MGKWTDISDFDKGPAPGGLGYRKLVCGSLATVVGNLLKVVERLWNSSRPQCLGCPRLIKESGGRRFARSVKQNWLLHIWQAEHIAGTGTNESTHTVQRRMISLNTWCFLWLQWHLPVARSESCGSDDSELAKFPWSKLGLIFSVHKLPVCNLRELWDLCVNLVPRTCRIVAVLRSKSGPTLH